MRVIVLGTVQDGGLPHPGCSCSGCEAARQNPSIQKYRSCLGIVTETGRTFLLDATPDLPHQLHLLNDKFPGARAAEAGGSEIPVDGIFLTHAHSGHYMGLWYLGTEALNVRGQRVFCTPKMNGFLRANQPWKDMISAEKLLVEEVPPGQSVKLDGTTAALAIEVPHRNEHSDTVCYLIRSRNGAVLYLPDLDTWEGFCRDFNKILHGVDHAFLDGTFYTREELACSTGRDFDQVPHPPITETLSLLQQNCLRTDGTQVHFIHLNHTNPLHQQESELIKRSQLKVAVQGEAFSL